MKMLSTVLNIPIFVIYSHLVIVVPFNIDVKHPIFFNGTENDYFGYSVGLLKNREGQYALITAPRANSTILHDQLYQPGVLFKCKILLSSKSPSCQEVLLDPYGNTLTQRDPNFSYMDKKDNMFLGMSLDIQQNTPNNRVVTCGHLWKNQYYAKHYLANGVCYVINNELDPTSVKKLIPLVNKSKQSLSSPGIYYYAFGQAGTSAVFSEDGRHLFLGAPGFYDWTGTVLSYLNPDGNDNYSEPIIPNPAREIPPESYVGYSVSSGKFFHSRDTFIAVGGPRDKNSYGQVYIVRAMRSQQDKFTVHMKKEGSQFGEYFGASVLGVDMNNDGYSDLLVGAPFHSSDSGGDEGKVYVYISNGMGLQKYTELNGENVPNARFGSCLTSIGDIDQDGFNDVAIGAPYEDGKGAVYIYHGTFSGMNPYYVQRLQATKLSNSLSGFGISISRGLDIDGNYYPDILIGSYDSSQAVLLRTHPVIKLSAKLDFSPQQINTNVTSCEFEGTKVRCVNITTCLHYTGKHSELNLDFETELYIDFSRRNTRIRSYLMFEGSPTSVIRRNITVNIGKDMCLTDNAFMLPDAKDIITPLDFLLVYRLAKNKGKEFCKTCPVMDKNTVGSNITKALSFQTGCGQDNDCLADLEVKAKIVGNPKNLPLIIGEKSTLTISVDVTNRGEPAYIPELLIFLPPETPNKQNSFCSVLSDQQKQELNATLLCELRNNPLLKDKTENIQIKIDVTKVPSSTEFLDILFQSTTRSTEINLHDNDMNLRIFFKTVTDIGLTGTSEHELLQYDPVNKKPLFVSHTYFIMNHGPSPVEAIDIELYVPTSIEKENNLIEFVSFTDPQTDSREPLTVPAICNYTGIELKPREPDVSISRDGIFSEDDLIAQNTSNRTYRRVSEEKVILTETTTDKEIAQVKQNLNENTPMKMKNYVVNCETAHCTVIRCVASPFIDSRKFARLGVSVMVNVSALDDVFEPWYQIEFITHAKIFLKNQKHVIQSKQNKPDEISVKTVFHHPGRIPPKEIAPWIIYVSIGIGVLLLIIILIVLIKVGFFKRLQKEKMREMMTKAERKEWEPYLITNEAEVNETEASNYT